MGSGKGERKKGSVPFNKKRSAFVLYIVVLSKISSGQKHSATSSSKMFENFRCGLFTNKEIEAQRDVS